MQELVFQYELTVPLWTRATKAVNRRIPIQRYAQLFWVIMPIVFAGLSVLFGGFSRDSIIGSIPFLVISPAVGYLLLPWITKTALAKKLASNPALNGVQTVVLSDEGFMLKAPAATTSVKWQTLLRIVETPEFFLFFVYPKLAYFLPMSVVPPDELNTVRAFIASHAKCPTELSAKRAE